MSLITPAYFVGSLNVAQLGQPAVNRNLQLFIDRLEPKIMEAAMGYDLWQDFLAGIAAPSPAVQWTNLRDGCTFKTVTNWPGWFWGFSWFNRFYYMNSRRSVHFAGFSPGAQAPYTSPIAGYVYYWWVRDQLTLNTGSGVVKSKPENSTNANPGWRMADAWNQMAEDIFILWQLLEADYYSAAPVYTSYDRTKINYDFFQPINTFNI